MADLVCSPNAAIAFDYLIGKGLRDFQAAAVIGNLQQESGINPRLSAPDPRPSNPAAMGRGIAMWGDPGRWQNLLTFAAGRDPWALDTQLDFLWFELPNNGLGALLASTTLEDATIVFQNQFEHPGNPRTENRIAYARSALFACPNVRPPQTRRIGAVAKALAFGALVAAAGYGVYRAATRKQEPPPLPPPRFPRPDIDWRDA